MPMSVGGVGRGGGKGRAGGAKGASGRAPAGKAGGASFGGSVDRAAGLVGPSGLVGSDNVQGPQAADPMSAQALVIAKQLKNGNFKSKDEAAGKLLPAAAETKA